MQKSPLAFASHNHTKSKIQELDFINHKVYKHKTQGARNTKIIRIFQDMSLRNDYQMLFKHK